MKQPLIHGDNIYLSFGESVVLENISFAIEAGSFTSILGPNGAGKTQLLRLMLGLIEPSRGQLKRNFSLAQVGYVPQKLAVDSTLPMTVQEFLEIYFAPARWWLTRQPLRFDAPFQVETLLTKPVGTLSGGQLQRVLLAAALSTQPRVLFLDEFASGIDLRGQAEMFHFLHRLNERDRVTIVLVSHDVDVTAQYADVVLCLNKRLICHGRPHDVFTRENFQQMYGLPLTKIDQHHHD